MEPELSPELREKLEELEQEFEEGDITQKGYQKRRTQLLSQYLSPAASQTSSAQSRGGLRIHTPDNSSHPSSDGGRQGALAALNAQASDQEGIAQQGPGHAHTSSQDTVNQSTYFPENRQTLRPHDSLFFGGEGLAGHNGPRGSIKDTSTRSGTLVSSDFAFNPDHGGAPFQPQQGSYEKQERDDTTRTGTMLSQGYFSDFTGQQAHPDSRSNFEYGGGHRYSSSDAFSPTAAKAPPMLSATDLPEMETIEHQMPLEPREVPFAIHDPHDANLEMAQFDNIAAVLRHRGRTCGKLPAYWVLDSRGKEIASITWDKLSSRAEKVAQIIRDKSTLYRGDRVALIYRDTEVIDFAIALFGCFIAGVVAVPINELQDYHKLNLILTSTQAHLALTTDNNLKAFQRDITAQKLTWPKGVEWWKTNEFGSYHPKKEKDIPALSVPELAYVEFSRAPTGDFRGVILGHRTIMHQMACLSAVFSQVPDGSPGDSFSPTLRDNQGKRIGTSGGPSPEILLSYLDPRHGVGMILGVLLTVYGGHTAVWMESKAVEIPGLYASLVTKYKATLMVADYPGLKRAAFNYQQDPLATRNFKKGTEPNFQSVKLCLIDTLTVDSEFHEVLADRWLRPLRNTRAREIVAPMLSLPEHGGMVISVRDWLGGEDRMGCPLKLDLGEGSDSEELIKEEGIEQEKKPATTGAGFSLLSGNNNSFEEQGAKNELSEILLDRDALKTNDVVIVAHDDEVKKKVGTEANVVRVGAFGYPIPDATLAVVDPTTGLLSAPFSIGEIWVDSPSLSGGFWALPKHTEQIFHARPYKFDPGNPNPTPVEPEFLRTGLLGTVIEGKIFVLGLYEDRIRQHVEWVEQGQDIAEEHRYYFVQHIVTTIMRNVPKIFDASAFDVFVNDEYLPVILLESHAASTAPATSGGPPRQLDAALLDSLAERTMDVLRVEHDLRVYCVLITAPNALPRVFKNGRKEIGNMLCRREFDHGNLPCVHVKFRVEHSVLNLPVGVDPIDGIWSPAASESRALALGQADRQYSGVDRREVVIDDRTSTPLNNFTSITDLIQWRVARQPDELAYCTIDGRGKEGKGLTWKKFDLKIAAVAMYLKNKVRIRSGDHVILMYTHTEDYVFAMHACINLGAVVIPVAPIDQNRLPEDVPALLHLISDYQVKAVLVNQDVDHLLKIKTVSQHIKQSAQILHVNMPGVFNTSKPPKQSNGLRELGLTVDPVWTQPGYAVIVWAYWTADQRRLAVQLGHDTILGMCKIQKETCQMTSSRPLFGCVRSYSGLGFLHTCLMGIYIGTPTYLLSPVEFAQNPISLFTVLSRYKIKDTYATPQMLDHAMAHMPGKGFGLHELKNLMITAEIRPRLDIFQKVRLHFAQTGLDRTAINTVYSHVLNPMIASRSYMCIEPIELWLDTVALRRGLIVPKDPETDPKALLIQDSGMVPVSTRIAIVNPDTALLCCDGEYGEIWVDSEGCVKSFYKSKDMLDLIKFDAVIADGDPNTKWVRTGDLGFLHNISRPIGPGGAQVDMQVLFVLGSIGDTFEISGLSHFPLDIENSVERSHRSIVSGGCAVFHAGGLVVVVVEVARKAYLASLVPVIVNAILNEHQIIADIVAFVGRGDFPRSRLGEKQHGKVLAGWVSRKLRTIAQFAIRDEDAAAAAAMFEANAEGTDAGNEGNRASYSSLRHSTSGGASAAPGRGIDPEPTIMEAEGGYDVSPPDPDDGTTLDNSASRGEGAYGQGFLDDGEYIVSPIEDDGIHEMTPTNARISGPNEATLANGPHLSVHNGDHGFDLPDFSQFEASESNTIANNNVRQHPGSSATPAPPPAVGPKPQYRGGHARNLSNASYGAGPRIDMPEFDERESLGEAWRPPSMLVQEQWQQPQPGRKDNPGHAWSRAEQAKMVAASRTGNADFEGGSGGGRGHDRQASLGKERGLQSRESETDWTTEAIMQMNLAGEQGKR